jgi:hypothetical protein
MKISYLCLLALVFAVPSYGYIDPGTGHLIWQFIAGVLIGSTFYLGKIRSTVTRLITGKNPEKKS